MKHIFITKNLNSLFVIKGNTLPECGFDLLNNLEYIKLNPKDLIEVDPFNKLFMGLLKNDQFKAEFVNAYLSNDNERSHYLGISERTYYRMKELLT